MNSDANLVGLDLTEFIMNLAHKEITSSIFDKGFTQNIRDLCCNYSNNYVYHIRIDFKNKRED